VKSRRAVARAINPSVEWGRPLRPFGIGKGCLLGPNKCPYPWLYRGRNPDLGKWGGEIPSRGSEELYVIVIAFHWEEGEKGGGYLS